MNVIKLILEQNVVIETQRLKIYPFLIEEKVIFDLYEIYGSWSNVLNYSKVYSSIGDFATFIIDKIEYHQNELNGFVSFVIERKDDKKIIGLRNVISDGIYTKVGLESPNNENVISEIIINENYWQEGFGFESSEAIFTELRKFGVKNILTFINDYNFSAKELDSKLGFFYVDFDQVINKYRYHKDFDIHTNNFANSSILIKTL